MEYPDIPECDFRQHPMANFKKPIRCCHCGEYNTDPFWATKEIGRSTMQNAFCNKEHADAFFEKGK